MRILIISSCGVEDRYLIGRIRAQYADTHVLQPVFWNPTRSTAAPALSHAISSFVSEWRGKLGRAYLKKKLFGSLALPPVENLSRIDGSALNSVEGSERVRLLSPDVILTTNAPILRESVYGRARLAALNVHYGIVPEFRGNHTLFWPLHLGQFDRVGISLHHLSPAVDQGELVARIYPALSPSDHELSVLARAMPLAADAVVRALRKIEIGSAPAKSPQEQGGRLFYSRERTWNHDLSYFLKWMVGVNCPPSRDERIEEFT